MAKLSLNSFAGARAWRACCGERRQHEANFWEGFSKEDPIKKRLEEAIKDLEKICRPIVEEQSGIASFLVKKLFKKK